MLRLAALELFRAMLSSREYVQIRPNCGGLQLVLRWDLLPLVFVGPEFCILLLHGSYATGLK